MSLSPMVSLSNHVMFEAFVKSRGFRRLLPLVVLALPACHSILGPPPPDERWHEHPGARVTFFVRPGSFAEQNVARFSEVMEEQYSATVRSLGLAYAGHMRAFLYESAADGDLPSNFAGRAYPETESFRFVAAPPMSGNLLGLMAHEANHVLIIAGLGRAGTSFMSEGLATAVVSETFHSNGRHVIFAFTRDRRGPLPKLATLMNDAEWSKFPESTAYNTSASFLAWLLDTYGSDRLRRIYGVSWKEIESRINSVYGRSLDLLEADWLRFCDAWVP